MKVFLCFEKNHIDHLQILKELLVQAGHSVYIFEEYFMFAEEINSKKNMPDLILLDFDSFNPLIFDLYGHLEEMNCLFPTIIYNWPLQSDRNFYSFWISTLTTWLGTQVFDRSRYNELLLLICDKLEELREEKSNPKNNSPSDQILSQIHQQLSLNESILFSIVENESEITGIEEIIKKLGEKKIFWTQNTINCYISRLNQKLEKISDGKVRIAKNSAGYILSIL